MPENNFQGERDLVEHLSTAPTRSELGIINPRQVSDDGVDLLNVYSPRLASTTSRNLPILTLLRKPLWRFR
jgi:hypothetical protein